MNAYEASQIIRAMLRQRRVRTTREEVEALDMAATALVQATETPRTGIEGYAPVKWDRRTQTGHRPRLETT